MRGRGWYTSQRRCVYILYKEKDISTVLQKQRNEAYVGWLPYIYPFSYLYIIEILNSGIDRRANGDGALLRRGAHIYYI